MPPKEKELVLINAPAENVENIKLLMLTLRILLVKFLRGR